MHRFVLVLFLALVLVPRPAAATPGVAYQPPVPGQVWQGFDPPDSRFGAGHRGVDLAVVPGEVVRSAAAGVVVHAGPVATEVWVTVEHADGVQTSYGALRDLRVTEADVVGRGQVIGVAVGHHGGWSTPKDPGLHWSARRGEAYVDPLALLRMRPRPTLVGTGGWHGSDPVVDRYAPYPGGARWFVLAPPSPAAAHGGYALAPNHHHLLLLPGYATEGPHAIVDPSFLGYGADSWSTFSYAGCDPAATGCVPRPYGGHDTDVAIGDAAALLEAQLRALQAAQPGRPVDLVGHSMGGDVATYYLEHVHDPSDPGLPPIGNLVTIATPHGGSGTGYLVRAVGDTPGVGNALELARMAVAGDGPLSRVGFGSEPLHRYGSAWGAELPDRRPERLEQLGVEVLEIAGSRDAAVSRTDASASGDAVVLPGGHTSVLGTQALYQAIHDHLGAREVTGAGGAAGWLTDELAVAGRVGGAYLDVRGLVGIAKSLVSRDAGRITYEVVTEQLPGPNQILRDGEGS